MGFTNGWDTLLCSAENSEALLKIAKLFSYAVVIASS
jgi:hypothetical protein